MKDLNDMLYGKPLYPDGTQFEKSEKKEESSSPLSSSIQNILPLILGMKNGSSSDMLSSILSKNMGSNPLFQMLSTFDKKKESDGSPKIIPKDELF